MIALQVLAWVLGLAVSALLGPLLALCWVLVLLGKVAAWLADRMGVQLAVLMLLVACATTPPVRVAQQEEAKGDGQASATVETEHSVGVATTDAELHVSLPQPETPADVAPDTPIVLAVKGQKRAPAKPPAPAGTLDLSLRTASAPVSDKTKTTATGTGQGAAKQGQKVEPVPQPASSSWSRWWLLVPVVALVGGAVLAYRILR